MANRGAHARLAGCGRRMALGETFRRLWEQHVMWTRSFVISTAEDLRDLQPVTDRLLRNPEDFARELRPYFGYESSRQFSRLLTEHLMIGADIVNAAKAVDTAQVESKIRDWYGNADEIAAFLSGINPYWSKQEWQNMLYTHLKMTTDMILYRLDGQYASDIAQYELIETQALTMADEMSEGIGRKFRV